MKAAIPTSRPWLLTGALYYFAGFAGLVAGCVVLFYAPEFAAWYKGVML
jgi:hypothetical protein